jgi:hypothetical protein
MNTPFKHIYESIDIENKIKSKLDDEDSEGRSDSESSGDDFDDEQQQLFKKDLIDQIN